MARIAGGGLAVLLTAAVVGLSQVPWEVESSEAASLRLSWRFRAAVEECRELSEEELAELPAHMRRPVICERRVPPHRLRVEVDGRPRLDEVVRAAGAQEDRPLYVFREVSVEPGRHRVRVRFQRVDDGGEDRGEGRPGEGRTAGERDEEAAGHPPSELTLETTIDLEPREVGLIVYDPGAGVLRRVERSSSGR